MSYKLAQDAIVFALERKWEKAIEKNKEILKTEPKDIDALNRVAKAYYEIGDVEKAREYTQKVLEIDPLNSIAQKCLMKYSIIENLSAKNHVQIRDGHCGRTLEVFLEEPGKTKIIPLLHLGDCQVILSLDSGNLVHLFPSKHRVSICTHDGKYIGRLPDDLASRIINLVRAGNEYQAFIKSVTHDEVTVFIKEIKKSGNFVNRPSFPFERRRISETPNY